ncbi:MAG: cation transporter [Chloroflexi bacterium]|nr:cation transporter [Chloroflexota bacterium]
MSHAHGRGEDRRRLAIALVITLALLVAEVVGGILTGSLALAADGGHMASDAGALGLSLGAIWLAARPATTRRTFGFHRAEILAAFVNSIGLALIAGYIFWQAGSRFGSPPEVDTGPMLGIAVAGLAGNIVAVALLFDRRRHSLNMRSAFLHVIGDTVASFGVIAAGVAMAVTGEYIFDPLISVGIGVLILISSFRITWESTQVLLEATPPDIHVQDVQDEMLKVPRVGNVHDLHIWTVTSGFVSLSAHVETSGNGDTHEVLVNLRTMLARTFRIEHATLQLETRALHEELEACCGIDTKETLSHHALHHT